MRVNRFFKINKLTTLLVVVFFLFSIHFVNAQTADNLQAQIQQLLDTIAELQKQVKELEGTGPESPPGETISAFAKNLRFGDRSQEVKNLQKTLNVSPDTRVADSGPGSLGQETDFFGNLTKIAVIKFQNKYSAEILTPVGLSQGTGFVGPSTRAKLNASSRTIDAYSAAESAGSTSDTDIVSSEDTVSETTEYTSKDPEYVQVEDVAITPTEGTVSTSLFAIDADTPTIFYPSQYDGTVGTDVSLFGAGFTQINNTILFGNTMIDGGVSQDGSTLTFSVPDVSPGRHNIIVVNENGQSDVLVFTTTAVGAIPPTIESLTPDGGPKGTVITINGSGFMLEGNAIYTGYSILENVPSSDGLTLTFIASPPDFSGTGIDPELLSNYSSSVSAGVTDEPEIFRVYVGNVNGFSNGAEVKYYFK